MKRQTLLLSALLAPLAFGAGTTGVRAADVFVSPAGNDGGSGARATPFATLQQARDAARGMPKPVTIHLAGGKYYLPETLVLGPEDSGVTWQANEGETPIVSGGVKLDLKWTTYKEGILQAKVPDDLVTEELFVNGERQVLARYPNFDPEAKYFNGYSADAISKERAARWADPAGGYFHAMHPAMWGGFTWRITGKDADGEITKEGGWQNNRGGAAHPKVRFVENIFEELDAPGEWFLNGRTHTLYFYPPAGLDLSNATVEATRLATLIELRGAQEKPVQSVTLRGITFRHANRTVMETKEPLLRTDWAIYRGGAIFLQGAEGCLLEDLLLDQVGGNAIFVNHYNRRVTVRGCEIVKAGASGVVFVGDPQAARNPLFNYDQRQKAADLDRTPGPKNDNYPADCLVEDCLIHLTGRVEKQTAGVNIDLAQNITVRHCSIYDMPRAGINIGDGCWGGHVVEWCDVFDTVKETGDHGGFNSWGRDRWWELKDVGMNDLLSKEDTKDLPLLDCVKQNILRNNRWRCDHGWDIDLDDGSSNYWIYNNLCLNGGIKNREGYLRIDENNVTVNNGFHAHVWLRGCQDIVRRNIFWRAYEGSPGVGKEVDNNLVQVSGLTEPRPAKGLQEGSHMDTHSVEADAMFIDPAHGDYRVKPDSPALALGFKNFPMDQFGVTSPRLKAKARSPILPGAAAVPEKNAIPVKSDAPTSLYGGGAASTDDCVKKQAGDSFRWTGSGQITWKIQVDRAGDYEVALSHAAEPGAVGQDLQVSSGDSTVRYTLAMTKGVFGNKSYEMTPIKGPLHLEAGAQSIALSIPNAPKAMAVLDFRSLELVPVAANAAIEADRQEARRARASTEWLAKAGYGLMFHWTSQSIGKDGTHKPYAQAVDDFDVKRFAEMVEETGAGYVILTIGHAESYCPAPLKAWEKYHPGKTTKRDLIAEMADALNAKGIKLMCYLNAASLANYPKADEEEFRRIMTEVLTEFGQRYKEKVAGYWIDCCYQAKEKYPGFSFREFFKACKVGNPDRLLALNSWIYPNVSEWQEYWAGETASPVGLPLDGTTQEHGPGAGLRYHALLIMEPYWVQDKVEMPKPRFTAEQLGDYISQCMAKGGAVTINLGIYQDGTVDPNAVDLLKGIRKRVR